MNKLVYVNDAAKLVHAINDAGFTFYGQAHRLGSREMDMIANHVEQTVNEAIGWIKSDLKLAGIEDADRLLEKGKQARRSASIHQSPDKK